MEQLLPNKLFDKMLNGNSNRESFLEHLIVENQKDLSYDWVKNSRPLHVNVMTSKKSTLYKISLKNNSIGYYYEENYDSNTSCGLLIECDEVSNFNIININIYKLYIIKKSGGNTYKSHNIGEAEKYIRIAFKKYILNNTFKLWKGEPLRKKDTLNVFFNPDFGIFSDSEVKKYIEYFTKIRNQRFKLSK